MTSRTGTDPTCDRLRFAELMACLSAACELSFGRSADHALHSCAVALRLANAWGLRGSELRNVYYHALLRFIGCNADTAVMASIAGDVIELRRAVAAIDLANVPAIVAAVEQRIRATRSDASPEEVDAAVRRGLMRAGEFAAEIFPGHCEVAMRLGQRLGFDERFVTGLGQLYARWDGHGVPAVAGEGLLPAVRVVILTHEFITHHRAGGWAQAAQMVRERSGSQFDPQLAALLLAHGPSLMADLPMQWDALVQLEPEPVEFLEGDALDAALRVLADYADIQSPWLLNHSLRVAELASAAARQLGMTPDEQRVLRRAALVHDIGRVGISADVWGRPGPLGQSEWDRVRMHSLYTAQILARVSALAGFARLAASAHERLDGSGYARGLDHRDLTPAAHVLAAADVVAALGEERAYRPAFEPEAAARIVEEEVHAGRLDRRAVRAVLACAGIASSTAANAVHPLPAGLSVREAQVLAELAHGLTNKEIARRLGSAPKTVAHQIESVYRKTGVRTRAGATLFAMEHGLVARARPGR
jgi:putative nucleotidyltransferase with HDIG domain